MATSTNLAILPAALPFPPCEPSENHSVRTGLTLYDIEDQLAALVDTLDVVPAEQEQELVARIGETLLDAVEKRDRMGMFLAHVDTQIAFADAEIKRLQERKQTFLRILERTEAYLVRIIQSLGQDARGRWQKLEGRTVTFSLRKQPPSVELDNEAEVPSAYRKATVKIAMPLWEELLDSLDLDVAGRVLDAVRVSDEVSKSAVKEALESGTQVPGAHLVKDAVKLKRGDSVAAHQNHLVPRVRIDLTSRRTSDVVLSTGSAYPIPCGATNPLWRTLP